MKTFDYLEAKSVEEAQIMLCKKRYKTKLIAGGTDLLLYIRAGIASPDRLVGISQINSLKNIFVIDNGQIEIGAAVTLTQVLQSKKILSAYQMISEAAGVVGSRQIRNLATIGGNNCSAVPSADTAPPLLAADAEVGIQNQYGYKIISLIDFFVGPKKTILGEDDLLVKFILPIPPGKYGSTYMRYCPRNAMNLAVAGVAVSIELADDSHYIKKSRIALGGVAPIPKRIPEAEAILNGRQITNDLVIIAAREAAAASNPITDHRATKEFRYRITQELTLRSIWKAIERAKEYYDK